MNTEGEGLLSTSFAMVIHVKIHSLYGLSIREEMKAGNEWTIVNTRRYGRKKSRRQYLFFGRGHGLPLLSKKFGEFALVSLLFLFPRLLPVLL